MNFNSEKAKAWLKDNVRTLNLIPANSRRYTFGDVSLKLGTNMLGLPADLKPIEGTVIHRDDGFYVVKTGRTEFQFVDPSLLQQELELDSKVHITPYARRRFNGTLLSDPEKIEDCGNGIITRSYTLGVRHSEIPVTKPTTVYTQQMLELLHHGKCTDGVRVISNLLVDCKARNFRLQEPPAVDEETGESIGPYVDPQILFDCMTSTFTGEVTIGVDVAADVYYVELKKPDADGVLQMHAKCEQVYFDRMAEVLEDLLCDGSWKFAKVEVLKRAPKRKQTEAIAA